MSSTETKTDVLLKDLAQAIETDPQVGEQLSDALPQESYNHLCHLLATGDQSNLNNPVLMGDLRLVCLNASIPFVGFGFIDNLLMIVVGDYLDIHLGAVLGFSTMAAAGMGNLISDVAGVGLGGTVDHYAKMLGLPAAKLTLKQLQQKSVRLAVLLGHCLGVSLGCLLGMFPLLFFNHTQNK